MQNMMVIFVEFGWISEIIILDGSYAKDNYFLCETLRTSKKFIFVFNDVKDDYFWCSVKRNYNNNHFWLYQRRI